MDATVNRVGRSSAGIRTRRRLRAASLRLFLASFALSMLPALPFAAARAEMEITSSARAHVTPDQLALARQPGPREPDEVSAPHSVDAAPPPDSHRWGSLHTPETEGAKFDYDSLPGRLSSPNLRPLWGQGMDLERREALLESSRVYELIVGEVPEEAFTYWRLSRNYWRHGESLPVEAKEERVRYFELAESWAARGLSIDPDCAPCMLWKFTSMGRQATTKGLLTAVSDVREMQELLKRGIELKPDHADDEGNQTLGNLYYSGAVFYRVIPDWFWLRWFIGIRGDKELSVEYARKAVEIASVRVDYRVELGAALLCYGTDKARPAALEEGVAILEEARGLDFYLSTDHLDREHAGVLIKSPEKACGYSRDGFIDIDQVLDDSKKKH